MPSTTTVGRVQGAAPVDIGEADQRCGAGVVAELNAALLGKAQEDKVVKTDRVRTDTTVVPADVKYPTDSGLLVRAITLIVVLVARIHGLGVASRTKVADYRDTARQRARMISAHLNPGPQPPREIDNHQRSPRPGFFGAK